MRIATCLGATARRVEGETVRSIGRRMSDAKCVKLCPSVADGILQVRDDRIF